jgi:hypothetical protein
MYSCRKELDTLLTCMFSAIQIYLAFSSTPAEEDSKIHERG